MTDAATYITAGVPVLSTLGGGVAFVWTKIERRFKAIEAKVKTAEDRLEECKERDRASRTLISKLILLVRLLAAEINPASPVLNEVRRTLDEAQADEDADREHRQS